MNWWPRTILSITAFSPALVTYAMAYAVEGRFIAATICAAAFVTLWLTCDCTLRLCLRKFPLENLRIVSAETADNKASDHLLIYLLPLVTTNLTDHDWITWIVVVPLYCIVVGVGQGYQFNPLLIMSKFKFYKVSEDEGLPHVLVTKKKIRNTKVQISAVRISEYMYLDKG